MRGEGKAAPICPWTLRVRVPGSGSCSECGQEAGQPWGVQQGQEEGAGSGLQVCPDVPRPAQAPLPPSDASFLTQFPRALEEVVSGCSRVGSEVSW